ncbi:hypothetical protein LWI29_018384 [Acer saccharum]|uniref:Leucine-rich repeat-containing N-terminal plant-type domain-containing protein n=1 Tax=Acer saccharum TaxID=4024 RepID=A0AA39RD62_ACESA|nr:hypothetical protein LWI29_018384 [Acer saccharum]
MASFLHSWILVWLAVLIFIVSLESGWSEGCLEQERFALLQLKPFFNSLHYLDNWVEGDHNNSDCCQWERVGCNDTTGRVISLHLWETRNLLEMGEWYLNASLFSPFQQLHSLYLIGNQIAGCVENQGWRLSNLEYLDLSSNIFNDNILSSLSALSSFKTLYLRDVGLKGSVDLSDNGIVGLKNLQFLSLGNVSIHDGSALLQSLGSLPYLKRLDLSYNNFSGNIMSTREFHNFTNLEELTMRGASLHTSFLQSIVAFTSLERLIMEDCQFNDIIGTKDNGIVGLKNLQFLSLRNVSILDGSTLLQSLGSLPYLKRLDLSYNNFSGNIMSTQELHNFTNLEELTMQGASLHTSLLQSIAAFASLKTLDMSDCQLNGIIGTKDGAASPFAGIKWSIVLFGEVYRVVLSLPRFSEVVEIHFRGGFQRC